MRNKVSAKEKSTYREALAISIFFAVKIFWHNLRIDKKKDKKNFRRSIREFLSSSTPFLLRLSISRCTNDGPASRNCTKHYPGSLPGVLSRVLPRDPSLCIYRRGYLRAPPRLLITISTTVFYRENGGRYSENKRQNVSA